MSQNFLIKKRPRAHSISPLSPITSPITPQSKCPRVQRSPISPRPTTTPSCLSSSVVSQLQPNFEFSPSPSPATVPQTGSAGGVRQAFGWMTNILSALNPMNFFSKAPSSASPLPIPSESPLTLHLSRNRRIDASPAPSPSIRSSPLSSSSAASSCSSAMSFTSFIPHFDPSPSRSYLSSSSAVNPQSIQPFQLRSPKSPRRYSCFEPAPVPASVPGPVLPVIEEFEKYDDFDKISGSDIEGKYFLYQSVNQLTQPLLKGVNLQNLKVLVVEDDPFIRERRIVSNLTKMGVEKENIDHPSDWVTLKGLIENQQKNWHVVILDNLLWPLHSDIKNASGAEISNGLEIAAMLSEPQQKRFFLAIDESGDLGKNEFLARKGLFHARIGKVIGINKIPSVLAAFGLSLSAPIPTPLSFAMPSSSAHSSHAS